MTKYHQKVIMKIYDEKHVHNCSFLFFFFEVLRSFFLLVHFVYFWLIYITYFCIFVSIAYYFAQNEEQWTCTQSKENANVKYTGKSVFVTVSNPLCVLVDTSDYTCWCKIGSIACGTQPLDTHSSSVLEDCEQGHFLFRLLFQTSPKSTNIDRSPVYQYCDKDTLSSIFHICIFFWLCARF
jgi:Ca2+/Na+ antiporter